MSTRFGLQDLLVVGAVLAASIVLTGVVRRFSLSRGLLDVPNPRSSHEVATARGGGLAIVASFALGLLWLALTQRLDIRVLGAFALGGLAVAAVGLADDWYRLSVLPRLLVHLLAGTWALACLDGLAPVMFAGRVLDPGWVGQVLAVLACVWAINVFNFMDGIDGLAASEAVFVAASAVAIGFVTNLAAGTESIVALVFVAACAGFLLWNWPPARIFMGDVGSGFLGFAIAGLVILAARDAPAAPFVWLILAGVFVVDTAVTLIRRLLRRERVYEAHRTHAYQWLARRWGSHRRVTLAAAAVNVFWLLPCAAFAALHPELAHWTLLVALTPLAVAALALGAGRPEPRIEI